MKTYTDEQKALLWLHSEDTLSWRVTEMLIDREGSAALVWDHFGSQMESLMGKAWESLSEKRKQGPDYSVKQLEKLGCRALFPEDNEYPERLKYIEDRPRLIYAKGTIPHASSVAIVGSRRDTRYGKQNAFRIAAELSKEGVNVISGLARGIDTAAHEGALSENGCTAAVLGCGIDLCYPPENKVLLTNILDKGGAILTEYPPGSQPVSYHFPLRNRIISGMADALLLIEARLKSGTNSTVNYALSQGREVFCLPGNVDAPGSELPLKLLKEGASICTCGEDIMSHMGWKTNQTDLFSPPDALASDDPILRLLSGEEKTFEELLVETGMDVSELNAQLTILQFTGKIAKHAGRTFSLL